MCIIQKRENWIISQLSQLWGITLHVNCVGRALFNSNMFLDGCWWCQLHAGVVHLPPLGKLTLISTAVFLVFSICYVLNMGKPIEVDDFQLELIGWFWGHHPIYETHVSPKCSILPYMINAWNHHEFTITIWQSAIWQWEIIHR